MAAYATITHLDEFGIPSSALEGFDSTKKQAALDAASSVANGYLGAAFVLPLTSWGDDLRQHVVAIAIWNLVNRKGFNPDGVDALFRMRYEDAIDWLRRVADGRLTPDGLVDSTPETFEGASFSMSAPKRGW